MTYVQTFKFSTSFRIGKRQSSILFMYHHRPLSQWPPMLLACFGSWISSVLKFSDGFLHEWLHKWLILGRLLGQLRRPFRKPSAAAVRMKGALAQLAQSEYQRAHCGRRRKPMHL